MKRSRQKIYSLLHDNGKPFSLGWWLDFSIIVLILLSSVCVILETVPSLREKWSVFFRTIEIISVSVFTLEYLIRVWISIEMPGLSHPVMGRLRYMFRPMSIIDLLAIIPLYLPLFAKEFRALRLLRVLRIFRLLKIARYISALDTLHHVFVKRRAQLVICIGIVMLALVFISSLMYYVENEAQPDKFSSIPDTMWWGVATLTTVGYGDIYPITPMGKFLASLIALFGIGLIALPTGIIATGFYEELKEEEIEERECPHCGGKVGRKVDPTSA